jgi:alkanesulfonate monooxygenase SsuD/methylene tetrahydromethanopterin reductase-like flavin-dependent oxidoreductase (luciferase family)
MRVGQTMYMQNYADWNRFHALERGENPPPLEPNTDASVWSEEIDAALLAEDQGFDSIWTVEHHVTPYTMITNAVQALTFFAGATSKIDVGTMIVVVPWHNPVRLAEEITMLQHVLRGRHAFIGFGRGLGRREYKAMGVDMNESRDRFKEGVEIVKLALTEEKFSYDGEIFHLEDIIMRPRPRDAAQLIDDMCFSWGSPSSAAVGASLGLRPMIIPQKDFASYHDELAGFAAARGEAGLAPARPRIHIHMFCDDNAERAEEMARKAIPQYVDSAMRNYELGSDHFGAIKGYEHYEQMASLVTPELMSRAWIDNCVWGTPDQCIEKLTKLCDAFHPEEFMLTGRYGDMPRAVAKKSLDLFAREVLPAVQAIPHQEPISYLAGAEA